MAKRKMALKRAPDRPELQALLEKAKSVGAIAFLYKPCDESLLQDAIEKAFASVELTNPKEI